MSIIAAVGEKSTNPSLSLRKKLESTKIELIANIFQRLLDPQPFLQVEQVFLWLAQLFWFINKGMRFFHEVLWEKRFWVLFFKKSEPESEEIAESTAFEAIGEPEGYISEENQCSLRGFQKKKVFWILFVWEEKCRIRDFFFRITNETSKPFKIAIALCFKASCVPFAVPGFLIETKFFNWLNEAAAKDWSLKKVSSTGWKVASEPSTLGIGLLDMIKSSWFGWFFFVGSAFPPRDETPAFGRPHNKKINLQICQTHPTPKKVSSMTLKLHMPTRRNQKFCHLLWILFRWKLMIRMMNFFLHLLMMMTQNFWHRSIKTTRSN